MYLYLDLYLSLLRCRERDLDLDEYDLEEPELEELVSNHGVPLTTLTAGPLMACFSNVFETPETPLFIMDRLIFEKDQALVNII